MIHDQQKFSVGDKVRVVKLYSHDSFEECDSYDNGWSSDMDNELKIGDILPVLTTCSAGVYFNDIRFGWPSSCFELYVEEDVTPIQKETDPCKIYAIWNYDQYPFALSSEINTMNSEMVTVTGYGGMKMKRRNVVIVDFDPEPILDDLRRKFDDAINGVREEFKQKALNIIPKLKHMKAYENV